MYVNKKKNERDVCVCLRSELKMKCNYRQSKRVHGYKRRHISIKLNLALTFNINLELFFDDSRFSVYFHCVRSCIRIVDFRDEESISPTHSCNYCSSHIILDTLITFIENCFTVFA